MAIDKFSKEELLARAKTKGYNYSAYRKEDTVKNIKTYKDKILKD